MKRFLLYTFLGLGLLFMLVFYNYLKVQAELKNAKTLTPEATLVSFPESLKPGGSGNFIWRVTTSPDLSTSFTTIYWDYISSPSALTKNDSPQAVGYRYSSPDYQKGEYKLPDNFDLNIKFENPGKVYFRAYAKVGSDHLWSEEESLTVFK